MQVTILTQCVGGGSTNVILRYNACEIVGCSLTKKKQGALTVAPVK